MRQSCVDWKWPDHCRSCRLLHCLLFSHNFDCLQSEEVFELQKFSQNLQIKWSQVRLVALWDGEDSDPMSTRSMQGSVVGSDAALGEEAASTESSRDTWSFKHILNIYLGSTVSRDQTRAPIHTVTFKYRDVCSSLEGTCLVLRLKWMI